MKLQDLRNVYNTASLTNRNLVRNWDITEINPEIITRKLNSNDVIDINKSNIRYTISWVPKTIKKVPKDFILQPVYKGLPSTLPHLSYYIYNKEKVLLQNNIEENSNLNLIIGCSLKIIHGMVTQSFSVNTDTKYIPYFHSNNYKEIKTKSVKVYRSGISEIVILNTFFSGNINQLEECKQFTRFLRTLTSHTIDYTLFYSINKSAYDNLSEYCKSLLSVGLTEDESFNLIPIYKFNNPFLVASHIYYNLPWFQLCVNKVHHRQKTLQLSIEDLAMMDISSQINILDRICNITSDNVTVLLLEQNEIGRLGRRYNLLTDISKRSRNHLNLIGYDMESALQTIIYNKLNTFISMPWTHHYINNKASVRLNLVNLSGYSLEVVKMEITAIYQGRFENTKRHPIHEHLKDLFKEVSTIREYLYNTHWKDKEEVFTYARKRTNKKNPNKTSINRLQNTFMFFYWTYFERKVQNTMGKYIENPLFLHDAVYTQCDSLPDKDFLEAKILEETGITMKLGIG